MTPSTASTGGGKTVTGGGTGTQAGATTPAELKAGWGYFIRAPRFPIAKTPRQRGGVRAGGTVEEAHFVLQVEATAERVFFLHGRDRAGTHPACKFVVEGVPREKCAPPELEVDAGWFVERHADPLSAGWSGLKARRISDLPPGDPLRAKLEEVIAAGPSGGTGGGGSAGGSA